MAIGINDLDDDDVLETGQEQQDYSPAPEVEEDDVVADLLRSKGIEDPTNINFEDDNGQLVSRNWDDLSRTEKLNILNTPVEQPTYVERPSLTDDELNFLSYIRQNGLSPTDYFNAVQAQSQAQAYEQMQPQYAIDDLSDDELYLLDLESRVGEITDEEAAEALSNAKSQNEELFKRQVEGIRKEYKEREDYANMQEQAQYEQQQAAAYSQYSNAIIDSINNMNSIGNLDIQFDNTDKEDLAEFMLAQDQNGKNYFQEALRNPENLTKAAWFLLNGEDAFNSITDYFTNQIKLVSDNQYRRGLEDGRKGVQSRPSVYINPSKSSPTRRKSYSSIDDLSDDED